MTVVPLQCPLCHGAIQIDSAHAGSQVACPHCQGIITVPHFGPQPPAPPQPPSYGFSPPPPYGHNPAGPQSTVPGPPPGFGPPPPPPLSFGQAEELLSLPCPRCGRLFQAPRAAAGQTLSCPHCTGPVTVPALHPHASAAPPPPTPPQPAFAPPSPASAPRPTPLAPANIPPAPRAPVPIPAHQGIAPVPTSAGASTALRNRSKTVGEGEQAVELRQLSREEKAKKRFRYNLIMWSICAFILSAVFLVLVWPALRK